MSTKTSYWDKYYPRTARVMKEWEVTKKISDFHDYVEELRDFCPKYFDNDFTIILQNFFALEEYVAPEDPYHRHGIISAHFMMRLIKDFPTYRLEDEEIFEMLVSALIHDCENKDSEERIVKYSYVHCDEGSFDYIFKGTSVDVNVITRIIKLVNETIYDDNNEWLEFNNALNRFVLGPRLEKCDRSPKSKLFLKKLSLICSDIIGQITPPGYRKMAESYLFSHNPALDRSVPKAFLELYGVMGLFWGAKGFMRVEEVERLNSFVNK